MCLKCKSSFYNITFSNRRRFCNFCYRSKEGKFSSLNNMEVPPLPECFRDLTAAEESIMCRAQCCISLLHLRHGQYAMSGHSIFFHQNLQHVADILPRMKADIVVFGKLRRDAKVCYLRVRRLKVLQCLLFLKKNNPLYNNICISFDSINQLPIDGHIEPLLFIDSNLDGADFDSFVPSTTSINADKKIKESLTEKGFIPYPAQSGDPVNEFDTPGLLSLAFPSLFPTNTPCYFTSARRPVQNVTFPQFVKFLLSHADNRFRKHLLFKFFAANFLMRTTAMNKIKQLSNITIENLQNEAFLRKIQAFTCSVVGSSSFFMHIF